MALPVELALSMAIYFWAIMPLILLATPLLTIGRYVVKLAFVSSLLEAASDHLRDSLECDIVGSFPGSPLILAILFDEEIPQGDVTSRKYQKQVKRWREGLKWEFYVRQYRAGRISYALFLTFTNDPRAEREHVKEDLEFEEAYQAKMESYATAVLVEDRSTSRGVGSNTLPPSAASQPVHTPLQPRALASCAETYTPPSRANPPPVPPKFRKLRGMLPRDSDGNIIWPRDRAYETHLMQEALARNPPPPPPCLGPVYRRWDSFCLTPGEKVKMKTLGVDGKLNLGCYCIAHRVQYVFEIHPRGGRRGFLDIRDGSYHEIWEWDRENDLPTWVPAPQSGTGFEPVQPTNNTVVPSFGLHGNAGTNHVAGPGRAAPLPQGHIVQATSFFPPVTTVTTKSGGTSSAPTPSAPLSNQATSNVGTNHVAGAGRAASLPQMHNVQTTSFLPPSAANTTNSGGTSSAPTPSAPPSNEATTKTSSTPAIPQHAGSGSAPIKFYSPDNPLPALSSLALQTAQIGMWMNVIKETLAGVALVEQFKGRYDNPGQPWDNHCGNAERYCRWIFEFAVDEDASWDTRLIGYGKAVELGFKSSWWRNLGSELYEIRGKKGRPGKGTAASPFVRLFAQFDKVHALFPRGQPARG